MRNSAFGTQRRRGGSLAELLENPRFVSVVRLFLVVVVALGGYIWQSEMAHVNRTLADLRRTMDENDARQWREVAAVKREVAEVRGEVNRLLTRTNALLFDLLERKGAPARGPERR